MLDVHPDPARRAGRGALERARGRFLSEAPSCEGRDQFYRAAQRFIVTVGDAHTAVLRGSESERGLPIEVELVAGQVVVRAVARDPAGGAGLDTGDVLLFANGQEVSRLLTRELALTPFNHADWGMREAAARLFDSLEGGSVLLTAAGGDGEVVSEEVPFLEGAELAAWRTRRMVEAAAGSIFQYVEPETKMGYLKYGACFDRTTPMAVSRVQKLGLSPEFLPDLFGICRDLFEGMDREGIRRLVVDLRGNGGGDSSLAHNLLNYLARGTLKTYGQRVRVSATLQRYMTENRRMYPEYHQGHIDRLLAAEPGSVLEQEAADLHYPYAGPGTGVDLAPFPGEVWVLLDAGTFSSGEWLAVQLRDNGLATFAGEPSGGGGDCPGDTLVFESPNLKLAFSVSYKLFRRPGREAARLPAVVPDFHVPATLAAYRLGRDPALDWLRARWQGEGAGGAVGGAGPGGRGLSGGTGVFRQFEMCADTGGDVPFQAKGTGADPEDGGVRE